MEAAIRWAPAPTADAHRYLIVDVAGNSITLNEAHADRNGGLQSERIARYDKIPNFTAFDWSKSDTSLLALGLSSGESSLLKVETGQPSGRITEIMKLPRGTQRKCNSISFNTGRLLAVGLDRVRNDHCLNVFDVDGGKEAHSKLCIGEAVSSVRFFPSRPQEIVAAVARQTLRLYDLRDPSFGSASTGSTVYTRQVNNIAIDPMDDNFFASGGSTGDPTVSVWDRRWLARSNISNLDGSGSQSVFDLKMAVDNTLTSTVWSIRFSGRKRGRFAIMGSSGAIRMYDLTSHSMTVRPKAPPSANFYGGNAWNGAHYISKTHDLQQPYVSKEQGQDESARCIAFDWVSQGAGEGQSMLTLRLSREVNMLRTPSPCHVGISARDELALCRDDLMVIVPRQDLGTTAEEMQQIRQQMERRTRSGRQSMPAHRAGQSMETALNARALETLTGSHAALQRTQSWIQAGPLPTQAPILSNRDFPDALAMINTHKRRCEEGYRFNCEQNRRILVDDPVAERLWAIISRLESLAANGGMTSETMDLSYYGVQGIWRGHLGDGKNRMLPGRAFSSAAFDASIQYIVKLNGLPLLEALPEKTYYKRLLCLQLCGWCFSREGIEAKCGTLLEQKAYYRAVALAAFQGHRDLALNMLRNLTRHKLIVENGVGALLAAKTLTAEQREMCGWMQDDAQDVYLKALLGFIRDSDWQFVAENPDLNLSDRLSIALRYLSDTDLAGFIQGATTECCAKGDLSGVLLTGLTETCMPLFQSFLARTGDIQTCVLATAFTNPLYISDIRWTFWRDTYFDLLQSWRLFIERTKFSVEHAKQAVRKDGTKLTLPTPRQISLRCVHCNGSLAKSTDGLNPRTSMSFDSPISGAKTGSISVAQRVTSASGTICPRCGRHLPRCAICLQWLGTPEATNTRAPKGRSPSARSDSTGEGKDATKETRAAEAALSRFITFCASCNHGLHANHAKMWFAKHAVSGFVRRMNSQTGPHLGSNRTNLSATDQERISTYYDQMLGQAKMESFGIIMPADALAFGTALLAANGLDRDDANTVASCLVAADLRGIDTHGLNRLPSYITRILKGLIDPKGRPVLTQTTPVVAQVDAKNSFGFIAAELAMARAISMASVYGIGMVSVKHSNHFGMSAWLVQQAIDADMMSLVFTNSSPALPVWGGREKLMGVSPIACGAPGDPPFVLDMAPSVAARGKVYKALRRGETIPGDWALDGEGKPTDDPAKALEGVMLPMGGPKGSALAVMMDVFSGVFSGSGFAGGVTGPYDHSKAADVGHFLVAIKPDLFMSMEEFRARMKTLYGKVTGSEKMHGVDRIYFPGEMEQITQRERERNGIAFVRAEIEALDEEARKSGSPSLHVSSWRDKP